MESFNFLWSGTRNKHEALKENRVLGKELNCVLESIFLKICVNIIWNVEWVLSIVRRIRKIAKSDRWLRRVCRLSVRLRIEQHNPTGRIFIKFCICFFFLQICRTSSTFTNIGQEWRLFYLQANIHFWSYFAYFFLEWEIFQKNVVEKIKTHVLYSVTFRMWANVKKILHSRTGHRYKYGACALHIGYMGLKHTFRICKS
jgi:hypothetical protein